MTPSAGRKRGARINAISHGAEAWTGHFEAWHAMNTSLRASLGADAAPDIIDEWLIYQTLAGTWPITTERMAEYLTKAMREAKRHTFWDNPNEAYETAVQSFARRLIEDAGSAEFRGELAQVVASLDHLGRVEAIAQTILQITAAWHAGHLPRDGVLGFQPRRPRQSPPGRLRRTVGSARRDPRAGTGGG